jgi:exonuclease III
VFDIEDITFSNVYLPSGNDPVMRGSRENYAAEVIPQLLINKKSSGCIGGDWNSIVNDKDATHNQAQKISPSLKRLIRNFSWNDSFRTAHPESKIFSRYYRISIFLALS